METPPHFFKGEGKYANENDFYIPLRNNLGDEIRKFGRIGHSIPTKRRPKAGLDYRYTLIINNQEYIEIPKEQRIPNSQYQKLLVDADDIETEFSKYLEGFIKAAKKGRIDKEPLYRESALANYLKELKVIETDK